MGLWRAGKVVRWEDERGFGFIAPDEGGKQVFVHLRDIAGRRKPAIGAELLFRDGRDRQGRPCAVRAVLDGGASYGDAALGTAALAWYKLALLLLVCVGVVTLMGKLHGGVLVAYLGLSFVTFCLYAADKRAARRCNWRVAESTLHFWAVIGGWPGAAIAQQYLRHKSKKEDFRAAFYITVALNCIVLSVVAWFGLGTVLAWVQQIR